MSTSKILVASDVKGRHIDLFAAVSKATHGKTGPYDALLCVGQFFGEGDMELEEFISLRKAIPIPCYFIAAADGKLRSSLSINDLPEGGELCPNLHWLGPGGVLEVAGLEVAFLSGVYEENIYKAGPTATMARGRRASHASAVWQSHHSP